jgi:predicted TIM-barrel fold metal-dependent hydrolase
MGSIDSKAKRPRAKKKTSKAKKSWLRRMLPWLAFGAACWIGVPMGVDELGGAWDHSPDELDLVTPSKVTQLVDAAMEGIDPAHLVDYHTHVVGLGTGGTGASVHPDNLDWSHPLDRIRFEVYRSACGIDDLASADAQYITRLVSQIRGWGRHGVHHLLAFDKNHHADGTPNLEHTEFHVPNERVLSLAEAHPDLFRATLSVHPARKDALEALQEGARRGASQVKWLPNAMGIDPADPAHDAFYDEMKRLKLTLLTHAGHEYAIDAPGTQDLGNPLRLRRPLDRGVRVIVAHCASLGEGEDLDRPEGPPVDNFDLFLRLMNERKYEGILFGEISAVTLANRLPRPLRVLLERDDLHPRLVNGSDYPLPAVNVVIRLSPLVEAGFLREEEAEPLRTLYRHNPLLFDFVLKRTVRHPETGAGFPASVFMDTALTPAPSPKTPRRNP